MFLESEMSLLDEAFEKYAEEPAQIEMPASRWSELLENKNGELEEHEIPVAVEMVAIVEMRERGTVPDHYTATTERRHCGPVPTWPGCAPRVGSCVWCFNRIRGLPAPNSMEIADESG